MGNCNSPVTCFEFYKDVAKRSANVVLGWLPSGRASVRAQPVNLVSLVGKFMSITGICISKFLVVDVTGEVPRCGLGRVPRYELKPRFSHNTYGVLPLVAHIIVSIIN